MELFVGDLSSCCTEDDLLVAFSRFGEVKHVRIQRTAASVANNQKGSLGYGFVKMGSIEQAEVAMSALNGVQIAGRNIRVKPANFRVEDNQKVGTKTSVYIKYVGTSPSDFTNEEIIRKIYSTFGEVVDVTIRKEVVNAVSFFLVYKFFIVCRNVAIDVVMLLFIILIHLLELKPPY
jgi:RNA recognition motif-containing protein